MALLIEAYRVIIKLSALEDKYPGGLEELKYKIPSEVVYKDDDLLAVGFVNRDYSDLFTDILFCKGLNQNEVASVSQNFGLFYPASWLEFSKLRMDEGGYIVKVAHLNDEKPVNDFMAPTGWQFKGSLSDGKYGRGGNAPNLIFKMDLIWVPS